MGGRRAPLRKVGTLSLHRRTAVFAVSKWRGFCVLRCLLCPRTRCLCTTAPADCGYPHPNVGGSCSPLRVVPARGGSCPTAFALANGVLRVIPHGMQGLSSSVFITSQDAYHASSKTKRPQSSCLRGETVALSWHCLDVILKQQSLSSGVPLAGFANCAHHTLAVFLAFIHQRRWL